MVCVYCVSHAPALLMLDIPGYASQNAKLLLYLILVVQMSDVLQYLWGKLAGRHPIALTVSPNKTVEGFVGGVLSATALGSALWAMTPLSALAGRRHFLDHHPHGVRRRAHDVGHQARSRAQRLRHDSPGSWGDPGSYRLALLCRADLLSPHEVLLHSIAHGVRDGSAEQKAAAPVVRNLHVLE
jgi:hypothetical protein